MNLIFRPEAETEMLEAKAWYEERSPGLGLEFARAVEAALMTGARHPESARKAGAGCRRVLLRRFPYTIIFLPLPDSIVVVACFHQHRDPNVLRERLRAEN